MADPIGNATIYEFKYMGDGYFVTGKKAVKRGHRIVVEDARILLDKDDLILITTPRMEINTTTHRAWGAGKVKVRTRQFIMRGKGFDVEAKSRRIAIRREVHVKFFGKLQ
jgi:lipopolysaccharide export system protein LptC